MLRDMENRIPFLVWKNDPLKPFSFWDMAVFVIFEGSLGIMWFRNLEKKLFSSLLYALLGCFTGQTNPSSANYKALNMEQRSTNLTLGNTKNLKKIWKNFLKNPY